MNGSAVPILSQAPADPRFRRVKLARFDANLLWWLVQKGNYRCEGVPEGTIVLGVRIESTQAGPALSLILHHPDFPVQLEGVPPNMQPVKFHRKARGQGRKGKHDAQG